MGYKRSKLNSAIIVPLISVACLYFIHLYFGVLLFHTLSELFSVVVGIMMFVIVWNTKRFTQNYFLIYLGSGYFWIAILDTFHLLTLKGLPFFDVPDVEITLHFWIYTRLFEAILLLSAPVFISKKFNPILMFNALMIIALMIVIASFNISYPVLMNASGLTAVKIGMEYLIILLLILSLIVYYRRRYYFTKKMIVLLLSSIALTIVSELMFTLYHSIQALPFVLGHLSKFISFWLIYEAISKTTLTEPFEIMGVNASSYDAMPYPAVVLDENGMISQVNKETVVHFKRPPENLIHHHVHAFFHQSNIRKSECVVCQAINKSLPIKNLTISRLDATTDEEKYYLLSLANIKTNNKSFGMIQTMIEVTGQKEAERNVLRSKTQYLTLLESMPIGVFETDKNGRCIYVNTKWQELSGVSYDAALGDGWVNALYKDDKQEVFKSWIGNANENKVWDMEYRFVDGDNNIRWIMGRAIALTDDNREVRGYIGTAIDITDRKEVEHRLEINEERSRYGLAVANEGLWDWNLVENTVFFDARYYTLSGYEPFEFKGDFAEFEKRVHPQDFKKINENINQYINGDTSEYDVQFRFLHKSGEFMWIRGQGKIVERTENGNPVRFVGTHSDITEKRQIDEQLITLSQAIEQTPVSVIITDLQGNIEYVNSSFEKTSGYCFDEVKGKNPRILKSGNMSPNIYKELWSHLVRGENYECEIQNKSKSGNLYWDKAYFSVVKNKEGKAYKYMAVNEDISLRKLQEEQLLYQAHFDSLTHLPNRFLSMDRLSQALVESERKQDKVAIFFLDLDDFKKVNDSLGHEVGDKLLVEAAERLKHVVRSGDTVGRLGGDEFIVMLRGINQLTETQTIAEQLLNRLRDSFQIEGRDLILSASIGIAIYPEDGLTSSELLRNADAAMYHAKELGGNTYSFYTEAMNKEVERQLAIEEQIHGALERNEFSVYYQPKIDIKTRKIIGAEALIRWNNPALGSVSPLEFIPIAERSGMIIPIGYFVFDQALLMTSKWQQEFSRDFGIAVNLSPRQFRDPDLVMQLSHFIAAADLQEDSIELEITEGVLMSGHQYIDEALTHINALGVSIAMDDFGTGYSSLSYLRRYPFDVLKIDQSFVRDIGIDAADRELINAAIAMAHGLNLHVVAEGVETEEQYEYLKKMNCDYAQGYLFSRPLPAEEMSLLLASEKHNENN
ncbi:MAG TPA: EAL domain-containing protein [Aeromonadales bacterium]|nr:EAL domain-containing protein [Aeromonadales bacterium]